VGADCPSCNARTEAQETTDDMNLSLFTRRVQEIGCIRDKYKKYDRVGIGGIVTGQRRQKCYALQSFPNFLILLYAGLAVGFQLL
jgi:hypothetical protein